MDITNDITVSATNNVSKITYASGEIGGFNIGTDLTNSLLGSTLNLKGSTGQQLAFNDCYKDYW